MSESTTTTTSDMDMETVLTRAVQKLFKWQLSGLTGTLIVASMIWFAAFFVIFLILVFVMCVEYHYEKKERKRQDAELAVPQDNGKMWAEKRSSRENSGSSMRKIAPVPMPPIPVDDSAAPIVISDIPENDATEVVSPEEQPSPEPVAEESVVVAAPEEAVEETTLPSPEPEETEADVEAEEEETANTQEDEPEEIDPGNGDQQNPDEEAPQIDDPTDEGTEGNEENNNIDESPEDPSENDEEPPNDDNETQDKKPSDSPTKEKANGED